MKAKEIHPWLIGVIAILVATLGFIPVSSFAQQTIDSRIGELSFTKDFENGYPTDETVAKLYDEMDFQRAVQAYIWAIPLVGFVDWQRMAIEEMGVKNGQLVYMVYL